MAYQVLARSWRPQRFDELLGQEAVVRTLQNALEAETFGHAYLFSGLRGVGKTTVARLLAKAVNCDQGPTAKPCGECTSCTEIAAGSSMDVVELDGASNRGIDDVRELRELLRYRPSRDRYRVIIVDEVHMLTREAFNALLKSLEEPPPYILFIFATTERHKVPATILSRCQQLEFRPVATVQVSERLRQMAEKEGFILTAGAAEMIARAAEGSVRDALSLVDQLRAFSGDDIDEAAVAEVLGVPRFEQIARLVELLGAGDVAGGLALLREELSAGHDCTALFQETGRMLRTLLHLAIDEELEQALTDEQRTVVLAIAQSLGSVALTRMVGLWLEQEPLLRESRNRELALEVACVRLARWPAVQQLEALLAGNAAVGGGSPAPSAPPAAAPVTGGNAPESTPPTGAGPAAAPPAGPRERLSTALWEADQRQLAAAVDSAELELEDGVMTLQFAADKAPLAEVAGAEPAQRHLQDTGERLFGSLAGVRVQVRGAAADGDEGGGSLRDLALADDKVQLALEVIQGTIESVVPDREEAWPS